MRSWSRLRFITNIFTRLRFCNESGKIRLNTKGAPGTQPKVLYPWFEIESRRSKNDRIVFGHWSTLALLKDYRYANVYPLDTGCLWGGRLTALRIDREPFNRTSIACPESQRPKSKT